MALQIFAMCAARWIFVRESDVTREATKRFWLILPHKQQNPTKRPPPKKKGEEEEDSAILVVVALSFLLLSFDLKVGLILLLYETFSRSEEAFANVERNITEKDLIGSNCHSPKIRHPPSYSSKTFTMVHGGGHHHHQHQRQDSGSTPQRQQHHHHHQNHSRGPDDWTRHHQSSFNGNSPWMVSSPYVFNASPLSWFQRYYAGQSSTTGIYRQYRDNGYYSSNDSMPPTGRHGERRHSWCCDMWCAALWCFLCCGCLRGSSGDDSHLSVVREVPSGGSVELLPPPPPRRASGQGTPRGFWMAMLLTILLNLSLMKLSNGNQTWVLNPGESHQVPQNMLADRVFVTSGAELDVRVYSMEGACPPLTGSRLSLSDQQDIKLAEDDYQYDHFHLNQGSEIKMQVTPSSGSLNVYLLQGQNFLRQLKQSSFTPGSNQYLRNVFAYAGRSVKLSYQVLETDTYVLLYDNASTHSARFNVSYDLSLTTYDLSDQKPICENADSNNCVVKYSGFRQKECVLVQAVESSSVGDVVTVQIRQPRRYGWIIFLSALPILLYSLLPCGRSQSRSSGYEALPEADNGDMPPTISPDYRNEPYHRAYSDPVVESVAAVPVPLAQASLVDDWTSIPVNVTGTEAIPLHR
jgi:hypothetical protein